MAILRQTFILKASVLGHTPEGLNMATISLDMDDTGYQEEASEALAELLHGAVQDLFRQLKEAARDADPAPEQ